MSRYLYTSPNRAACLSRLRPISNGVNIQEIKEKCNNLGKQLGSVCRREDVFMSVLVICVGVAAFGLGKGSALVTESDESTGYIDRSPEMSSKTRHSASTTEYAGTYMASEQGTKYHLPWCPSAQQIHEENRVWFDSRADAVAAGYTPAANCEGL